MMNRLAASLVLFLLLAAFRVPPIGMAQNPSLIYQSRGQYREGIRTAPSTGPTLDLIGALITGQEARLLNLPEAFHALFFVPDGEPAFLSIREIQPRYFYSLGDVDPTLYQNPGFHDFIWPTDTVVRALNWEDGPIVLNDLCALVRLGTAVASELQSVAPVELYSTRSTDRVTGYHFFVIPSQQIQLTYEVFREGNKIPLYSQTVAVIAAKTPYSVPLPAGDWHDGWYRLVFRGSAVVDHSEVKPLVIRFYHVGRLQKQ